MTKKRQTFYFRFCLFVILFPLCLVTVHASIQPGWVGNFYVGASLGGANLSGGNLTTQLLYNGTAPSNPETLIYEGYSDSGLMLTVLGGYQEICERWLVGVEVNFDLQSFDKEHHYAFSDFNQLVGWSATARYQRQKMMGLSGRVGYALTRFFMPYARLGVEFSDDLLKTTYAGDPAVFPFDIVISQRNWVHRFLIGFGAEVPILYTCGATLRLEYIIHSRGGTIVGHGALIDGVFSPLIQSSMQPKMQAGMLSLVWNFF